LQIDLFAVVEDEAAEADFRLVEPPKIANARHGPFLRGTACAQGAGSVHGHQHGSREGHAQILAVFAEFETAIRSERQMDRIDKAKAKRVRFGRKAKATPDKVAEIRTMRETMTVPEIIKATGLSKASIYRAVDRS
jgi:hypothetical protein